MASNIDSEIKSAATLGFVGSILLILSVVSSLIGLVGLVLVLIALSRLSRVYNNPAIFNNALKGVIVGIIGAVIVAIISFTVIFTGLMFHPMSFAPSGMVVTIIVLFIVFYILIVIYGMYIRNAYNELAASSGVEDFRNAARWYWLGALLTIILIGAILVIVAHVYAMLGYRKLGG